MDLMRTESGPDRHVRIRACVDRLLQGRTPNFGATARAFLWPGLQKREERALKEPGDEPSHVANHVRKSKAY